MFDIGFLELIVVGIIALIVLGPERLPKAARTVGLWVGKAKQSFNAIKLEIDRELKVQELQQQLDEQKSKLKNQLHLKELNQDVLDTFTENSRSESQFKQEPSKEAAIDHTINPKK